MGARHISDLVYEIKKINHYNEIEKENLRTKREKQHIHADDQNSGKKNGEQINKLILTPHQFANTILGLSFLGICTIFSFFKTQIEDKYIHQHY